MKAEEFRKRWRWAGSTADALQAMVFAGDWGLLPGMMVKLLPYFADIKITKLTRKDSLWQGAYARLMAEKPPSS
jgi:hypothetical protein